MRACVQCGLSISETATFCQVCGARIDVDAAVATLEATQVVEAPAADAEPAGGDRWAEAQPHEPGAELVADLGAEPLTAEPEAAGAPERGAETVTPAPEHGSGDRRHAAVAALLEAASGCEDADRSRAAALYQEAILGCLDAADEDGGLAGVERELLRGFDGLSALLARQGLADEALEVVDDAAALGLLNGGARPSGGHCDALLARREDLRRLVSVDSADL